MPVAGARARSQGFEAGDSLTRARARDCARLRPRLRAPVRLLSGLFPSTPPVQQVKDDMVRDGKRAAIEDRAGSL